MKFYSPSVLMPWLAVASHFVGSTLASPFPSDNALAARDNAADNPTVCSSPYCPDRKHNKNQKGIDKIHDNHETIIKSNIPNNSTFMYAAKGPGVKENKRANFPIPQSLAQVNTEGSNYPLVGCFGEVCNANAAIPGLSKEPTYCTHLAGREYLPQFWTCCPINTYAGVEGACCTVPPKKKHGWHCEDKYIIPLKQYYGSS